MLFKKEINSLLLFLVFSSGFIHTLIPHCHGAEKKCQASTAQANDHHHHDHHIHKPENVIDPDHHHMQHNDHFDANLYDLIICVLADLRHPVEECSLRSYTPVHSKRYFPKDFSKNALRTPMPADLVSWDEEDTTPVIIGNGPIVLSTLIITNSPYRGPPCSS